MNALAVAMPSPHTQPDLAQPACRIMTLAPARCTLDARERAAADAGRRDASRLGWAGAPSTRLGIALRRAWTWATGCEPVMPFADPRLEQLRLFTAMIRRGDGRADATAEGLLRLGFSRPMLLEAVRRALA